MVRVVKRGLVKNSREFVHAFRNFSYNSRAYLASAFLQTVGGSMIATVLALYIKAAGMRGTTVGNVEGVYSIGMAVIALVGPPLVSTLGYRRLMVGALALLIASRVAQAFLPTPLMLIGLALGVGIGDGFLRTVNTAFLSENSSREERSHLFSAEFLIRMLAVFAGSLIGGFLPGMIGGAEQTGYQWTITAGAGFMAVGMVPMLLLRERVHGIRGFHKVYAHTARDFSAWGHLGRLVAPQAFLVAAGGLITPFVPLYLKNTLGASTAQIGLIQGLGALVMGVAAFATPALSRRFGAGKSAMMLQAAALPLLFSVPFIGTLTFGMLALFTRSTLMTLGGPLWSELSMQDVRAQDKPLVAGGLFFALSVAGFLGNVFGGQLMETSYTAPYLPAALLWAVGTGLTWLLWVRPHETVEVASMRLEVELAA